MDTEMDVDTIFAIAATALREYDNGCGFSRPQSNAHQALESATHMHAHPEKDGTVNGITEAFDVAFEFALLLGARIASDPMRIPEVEDLIEIYRFQKLAKAAA